MPISTMLKLAMTAAVLGALVGCGKAAPVQRELVIDSVFTKLPAENARKEITIQEQEQRDSDTDKPETTRVGGPGNDKKGFRPD